MPTCGRRSMFNSAANVGRASLPLLALALMLPLALPTPAAGAASDNPPAS